MKDSKASATILKPGLIFYKDGWLLQKKLVENCLAKGTDTFVLTEHPHVYTVGRAGSFDNIKVPLNLLSDKKIEVIEVDRGGDVTYHGPGQLVGYPILNLKRYGQDLHKYCRLLEEVIIKTLLRYDIKAFRKNGLTGVWTDRGKIASLGIGVRRWVSMHGFSLNVNPQMTYFKFINPCGEKRAKVTSMLNIGVPVFVNEVGETLTQIFAEVFNLNLIPASAD